MDPTNPLFLTDEDINAQYDPGIASAKRAMQDLAPRMQTIPTSPSQGIASALISALPMLAGLAFGGKAGAGYGGVAGGLAGANYNKTMEDQRERDQLYAQGEYKRYQDDVEQQERDRARAILSNKQNQASQIFDWQQRDEAQKANLEEKSLYRQQQDRNAQEMIDLRRDMQRVDPNDRLAIKAAADQEKHGQRGEEWDNAERLTDLLNPPEPQPYAMKAVGNKVRFAKKDVDAAAEVRNLYESSDRLRNELADFISTVGTKIPLDSQEAKAKYDSLVVNIIGLDAKGHPFAKQGLTGSEREFFLKSMGMPLDTLDRDQGWSSFLYKQGIGSLADKESLTKLAREAGERIKRGANTALKTQTLFEMVPVKDPDQYDQIRNATSGVIEAAKAERFPASYEVSRVGKEIIGKRTGAAPTSQPQSTAAPASTERAVTQITPEQKAQLGGLLKTPKDVEKAKKLLQKGVPYDQILDFFGD
jgi:hypothetical protein